jgi:hypothetical protein
MAYESPPLLTGLATIAVKVPGEADRFDQASIVNFVGSNEGESGTFTD